MAKFDFGGYATKNDLLCADGRTIRKNAFTDNDGKRVPLVWHHLHKDPSNVIGHAILENRDDGVYAYCNFNNSKKAQEAKECVEHGDITNLSIFANQLEHRGRDVIHGLIREVSLVVAGANPGAYIDSLVLEHSDEPSDVEGIFYTDEEIEHSVEFNSESDDNMEESISHADEPKKDDAKDDTKDDASDDETVGDVFDELTEKQKNVVFAVIGKSIMNNSGNNESEEKDMKHNLFDGENVTAEDTLTHADLENIIRDAKSYGSLKDSFLAHAADYGIDNIDYLFPEAKTLTNTPEFIDRNQDWVSKVMSGIHHTPFARVKSVFADITEDEARAKGYIKGKLKKEEVFTLLKRKTEPTTIYKKQKLDRDDIIDITDFDVVAWIKAEMRRKLDEEIARAILIGDGRSSSSDDKINEMNIRPIYTDADLFSIKVPVKITNTDDEDSTAKKFIKECLRARKNYKGSGNPKLFTTEDMLTIMLLLEDGIGHRLYATESELATALRVSEIVTVPVMENTTRTDDAGKTFELAGIIVNLNDYNVGADKGGAIAMFDDFDIDYNQQKYLIETRCSGALTKPFSAMILELDKN